MVLRLQRREVWRRVLELRRHRRGAEHNKCHDRDDGHNHSRWSAPGSACAKVSIGDEFSPVDGGEGRACRGASATDSRPSYYTAPGL